MIYLLLQIVFSSAFTLIIKWAQVRNREDVITVGAINYIVAALSVVPVVLLNPTSTSGTAAMLTGGAMGAVYFVAFFFVIYAVRTVGASSATVVSVLSILFPIALAAVIWDEQPNNLQIAGIGLALLALSLIGAQKKQTGAAEAERLVATTDQTVTSAMPTDSTSDPSRSETAVAQTRAWVVPVVLFVFFLLCGMSRLLQETFKHVSAPEQRPLFLLSGFTMAAIPSLILLIATRRRPTRNEILFGVLMGLANILQVHFILLALEVIPGFIVFPVSSAGAILLTTLVATGMLGEKLNGRSIAGITLAVVALFMLNFNP